MQIMIFPISKEVDLGIRMTEIRRIESFKQSTDFVEGRCFFPQQWFNMPLPEGVSGMKGIALASFRNATIAVPRLGRILRLLDPAGPGTPHKDCPFLFKHRTMEGVDSWVLDVAMFHKAISGEPITQHPERVPTDSSSGLFQQVGQTARDIQRVLALSGSMIDSLRTMEGKIPETSHGLDIISQMTEEAAHKLMNLLETIMEDHATLRTIMGSGPVDDVARGKIGKILEAAEEKIMEGFETMAFQDLVGQNIILIGGQLKELESRLVRILIECSTESVQKVESSGSPSGTPNPVHGQTLKGVGAPGDIDQDAVDQLLSEFGF